MNCDSRHRSAEERLTDVVSSLRVLLRPKGSSDMLVHFVYGVDGRGVGFRLDMYPHLWCDADAFEWYVRHGLLLDQREQDSTACWERAYQLAERGVYLSEQIEADWTRQRRDHLNGLLRDCVQRWTHLLREAGHVEEAIMRLRSYWLERPTEQDALRPLLELLGERERFQEAEECYEKARATLAEDGHLPDERTNEAIEVVRALKVRRKPHFKKNSQILLHSDPAVISLFSAGKRAQTPSCLRIVPQDILEVEQEACIPSEYGTIVPSITLAMMLPGEAEERDWPIWFGSKLAQLLVDRDELYGLLPVCLELQKRLDQELNTMKPYTNDEVYAFSRRQALVTLAALPIALLTQFQWEQLSTSQMELLFSQCTKSITACWHLLRGNEFTVVEEVLPKYLPILLTITQRSSTYRPIAAHLAAQCHLLMSLVVRHRGIVSQTQVADIRHCQQAVFYSETAEDNTLTIASLKQLADTFYYQERYADMRMAYQKAAHLMNDTQNLHEIPPLLKCRIYAGLANAFVKDGQREDAQRSLELLHKMFPASVADTRLPLYADCGAHSLSLWEGLTLLDFGEYADQQSYYRQAKAIFAKVEQLPATLIIPERTRIEIIAYQAATAVRLRDMDCFCLYIQKGAKGINALGSQKRRKEMIDIYMQGARLWSNEPNVQHLADSLIH